ncbi:ABC transporter ATP-binding protein [Methylomonas rivi]|uniref:ABC transporter ATP-binding protein n=1 Tax=Methylomonas rivi TaxID=2952226 RepID=A0ABT1U5M7_9GAMM|nr:ABC transporter ATP-binding protein [Methylomonas sp. WSC-6]MBS4049628.1 ABC transporter ATP-binding protein [Methylomonas sp.]MCQ8129167.1 ABC transporter ATP-binding protein [Methylomonas sp. WSC-6]
MKSIMTCKGIAKSYGTGDIVELVLKRVDLEFFEGQASVLVGPSGSGKTTLLSILGCLLAPSEGQLLIADDTVNFSDKSSLTEVRRQKLGFIFQHAQLLPFLTIEENLAIVGRNAGMQDDDIKQRLDGLLHRLELKAMRYKHPAQLSGGQRQRVAIARALLHRPSIVLADEPTAALDWNTGKTVVELLLEQARMEKAVLVVVTHDTRMLPLFDRILSIADGILSEQAQTAAAENIFYTQP